MASWRQQKAKALTKIHSTFEVDAVYWTHAAGTPIAVKVRDHSKQTRIENEFTWREGPGYLELSPTLIFDASVVSEVLPKSFVFMSASEVYFTDVSTPVKDGYISVDVTEADSDDVTILLATLDMNALGSVWDGILP